MTSRTTSAWFVTLSSAPVPRRCLSNIRRYRDAIYPTQLEEIYAAAKWVVSKGLENGLDGSRMAVAGNSVGGNMSAALAMMAKDRNGPKIALQVLMVPATDANVGTASYHEFASGFFLARAFKKFGWDIYAPAKRTRDMPYVSRCGQALISCAGCRPRS